mmetsp:Transcript_6140/g.18100  ORF Transcript_6140/g.18100 Transcript_6140/m.18100 type:complete len:348 (-) Transcript_6140:85-1128(-)
MGRSAAKKGGGGLSCLGIQRAVQGQFESLIKACAHNGNIAGAEQLLNRMHQRGEEPNLDDYNCIIHACAQAGDVVRAQAYLRRMVQSGITPNIVTYNTVINACAAQGDVAEAEMWLLHMKWRNQQPTEVTYGTICKALARAGNVERIEEIMGSLEQDKDGLALNEYFYASLISACGAADPPNIQRAEKVPFQMSARGLRPKSVKRALERVIGHTRTQQILQEVEGGGRSAGGEKLAAGRTRTTSGSKSPTASVCSDYNLDPPAAPQGSPVHFAGLRRDKVVGVARGNGSGYAPSTCATDAYMQQGNGYVPSSCATGAFLQQGSPPAVWCSPPTVWWVSPSMFTAQQH